MSFRHALYGSPPLALDVDRRGTQVSPLVPGAPDLGAVAPGTLESVTLLAPPGAIERRYVLAQALRALRPGGRLDAMAPKDKGGARLRKELEGFGLEVEESAKAHHRRCRVQRPADSPDLTAAIDAVLAEGGLQRLESLGLWTQPGVFSWNRVDPGSALLAAHLPLLSGAGADLGCGLGVLAPAVLASPEVTRLTLVDLDRRAIEAARRNVADPRADFLQADARGPLEGLAELDFVVTNPPFHDAGAEDRRLGQGFIGRAAGLLRKNGRLWLVANRHLPYEAPLNAAFRSVRLVADTGGYKLFEARK